MVLLPLPAFGHLMPYYQLALALAKSGVHVHYVSTPNNISRLPTPSHTVSNLIHFVSFPMPVLDTCPLPIGAEATVDITLEMWPHLIAAHDMLQHPLKDFVASLLPDWLIIDLNPCWAVQIGRDLGIPVLCFSLFSAASSLFFGPPEYLAGDGRNRMRSTVESLMVPPPWVDFPSTVAYRHFEACEMLQIFYEGGNPAYRMSKTLEGCEAVALRSCNEIEGEYLHAFAKTLAKPVIPIGLLAPEPPAKPNFTDKKWIDTFHWLDNQNEKSIIFVGFGSECRLKQDEIHGIARGLEISKLPFLWAIRRPHWAKGDDDTNIFPQDFIKNTLKRGRVCIGWAPQLEILGHPSVGASLFHSGWGSAIEAIQFGHRIVVLPIVFDQALNARMLVEKGLAIEVEREVDGAFTGEGIAKALIEAVVGGGGGERLKEAAAITSDRKLQQRYMDEFVKFLKHGTVTMKN